jgi:hypothetical protein
MRALVAAALVVVLAVSTAAPHVHVASNRDDCATCVLRHADVPHSEAPDVAPAVHETGDVVLSPGLPPVSGAPLGSIPGQSPPAVA